MANSLNKQDAPQEGQRIQPDTLGYWKSWAHVAPGMLKRISGGNLNGKTDINPVWRFMALTEAFGPCGFGWKIIEKERWTNEAAGEIGVSFEEEFIESDALAQAIIDSMDQVQTEVNPKQEG